MEIREKFFKSPSFLFSRIFSFNFTVYTYFAYMPQLQAQNLMTSQSWSYTWDHWTRT